MQYQLRKKSNMKIVLWAFVMSMVLATLTGCASVFKLQVLYEAPQPGAVESGFVIRLEKEQNPITGVKEEFPARKYGLTEKRIRQMMAVMYRRFFKDPDTFMPPPDYTLSHIVVGALVDSAVDSLIGKTKIHKGKSGSHPPRRSASYRPKLREDGHPASMSKPTSVFTPNEIDALAPEIVKAFIGLRKGEHLTLRTKALDSKGQGGSKWKKSDEVTSVAIRFNPAGKTLGSAHGAAVSWDFYQVHGLDFRGKGGKVYTYSTHETAIRKEYEFLAVFPRDEGDTDYWRIEFPVQ